MQIKEYLSEKVLCLKKAGAEVISLTAVTMHIVFEELVKNTGVSLISIPKAVCKEVKDKGYKKILLLGGSSQQVIAIETAKRSGVCTVLCDYLPDSPQIRTIR